MSNEFMQTVDRRSAGGLASGALHPPHAEHVVLEDDGLPFNVRWSSVDSQKKGSAIPAGGPRDPDFNPFLPPDPELTVGPVGDHHVAILNKFPVSPRHLVLARTEFHEQQTGLEHEDFLATALILSASGGLGFYNGGAAAGASQRHKHVQWIPQLDGYASLGVYTSVFNDDLDDQTLVFHPGLPLQHCFVRVLAGTGIPVAESAANMLKAYGVVLKHLGLRTDNQGFVPPFNLLVEDGWMLVVPRRQEHFEDISVNALSYGGLFQVQRPTQIDSIRKAGPLAVLAATAHPVKPT